MYYLRDPPIKKSMEKHILNFLKEDKKYIHAKEYGNEYFQCNLHDLISDIYNLLQCQI